MTKEKIADKIKTTDEKTLNKLLARAEKIKSRGLDDEDIILQLVADEYSNNYKVPSILGAGMYDKMNHMCRCYMDRTVRFSLYYDYIPDVETLKKVIICLFEKAPIFHSKFWDNHIIPCWVVSDYHIDEVFQVVETDDIDKSVYDFSIQSANVKSNVQMKICLFVKDGKCALAFRWNHMVVDGGGFKQMIKDITDNYHRFRKGETDKLTFRTGTRRYDRVYEDMEHGKQAKMKFSKTFAKDKHKLPYTKKAKDDKIFINKRTLPNEVLTAMLKTGKECGGTLNDVFVSAYLRACYRLLQCDKNEGFTISCAMDLRRYIKDIDTIGYTNHTNFMPCQVSGMGESIRDTITELAKNTKAIKADEFNGLHGLPLLNVGYSTMIYLQAELVVRACYYNADFQVSNLGAISGEKFMFDGNDVKDAFMVGSAKWKPTTAVSLYTVGGNFVYIQPLKGNDKDREISDKLFDLIEEELRSLV
jgi:NRPS condensation-like uncharacterized protein